jgi:hypothetical protein
LGLIFFHILSSSMVHPHEANREKVLQELYKSPENKKGVKPIST